jgi:hypothetical protein
LGAPSGSSTESLRCSLGQGRRLISAAFVRSMLQGGADNPGTSALFRGWDIYPVALGRPWALALLNACTFAFAESSGQKQRKCIYICVYIPIYIYIYIQRLENTLTWFIDLWVNCTWLSSPKFSTVKFRFQLSFVFQVCFWPPFLPPYYPSRRYYSPAQRG